VRRLALPVLGASLLFATLWLEGRDAADGERGPAPGATARPAPGPAASLGSSATAGPAQGPPGSLRGTQVDGGFVVDAAGHLVPTPDALALFDYFLAATGEEPLTALRARIVAEIRMRLAPPAAPEAEALLDAYLAYRDEARRLFESGGEGLPLERRVQLVRELRRQVFGPEVARALFAAEEERWFADLELRRVLRDPDLSPDERARRIEAVEAELPAEVGEARRASEVALQLRRDEAALSSVGAGPAEIHALRVDRFGEAAAGRLAALDDARASWDARVADWQEERARILAEDPGDPAAALEAARRTRFEGAELRRIRALDAAAQHAAAATRE